jgi:hypothetical protein
MEYGLDLSRVLAVFVKDLQAKLDLTKSELPEDFTALRFIAELKPASWIWNSNEAREGNLDFGFIAQEVLELQKKYSVDFNLVRPNGEYLWLYSDRFVFVLLCAVQELLELNPNITFEIEDKKDDH